eukprot:2961098-Pyramimonas_sp.AAC.1
MILEVDLESNQPIVVKHPPLQLQTEPKGVLADASYEMIVDKGTVDALLCVEDGCAGSDSCAQGLTLKPYRFEGSVVPQKLLTTTHHITSTRDSPRCPVHTRLINCPIPQDAVRGAPYAGRGRSVRRGVVPLSKAPHSSPHPRGAVIRGTPYPHLAISLTEYSITSFYWSSCAHNGKGALNTPAIS